jgi:3-hydroxyacyl-CoA dehydrogenase
MGHGIAQVAAMAGYQTRLTDASPDALTPPMRGSLESQGAVSRGKITQDDADAATARIVPPWIWRPLCGMPTW